MGVSQSSFNKNCNISMNPCDLEGGKKEREGLRGFPLFITSTLSLCFNLIYLLLQKGSITYVYIFMYINPFGKNK